jgi:hypothetical protein
MQIFFLAPIRYFVKYSFQSLPNDLIYGAIRNRKFRAVPEIDFEHSVELKV